MAEATLLHSSLLFFASLHFASLRFGLVSFLRQSILLLYVFPFSCRPLGWSLYLYLCEGGGWIGVGHAKCLSILFVPAGRGIPSRVPSRVPSWVPSLGSVRIYAQSLGVSICLLGVFAYTANVGTAVRVSSPAVLLSGTSFRVSCLCNRPH